MAQAKTAPLLTTLHFDVEHHYRSFLRIAEVCILGTVCHTLHERVQTSFRSHPWDAVHHKGVDPEPSIWLIGIVELGLNLRSLRLVCSLLYAEVFLNGKPPWVDMVPYLNNAWDDSCENVIHIRVFKDIIRRTIRYGTFAGTKDNDRKRT